MGLLTHSLTCHFITVTDFKAASYETIAPQHQPLISVLRIKPPLIPSGKHIGPVRNYQEPVNHDRELIGEAVKWQKAAMREGTKQQRKISKQDEHTLRNSTEPENMTIQEVISRQRESVKWREASDKNLRPLRK